MIAKITFLTDWHLGSGVTGGMELDAVVIKDGNGLPFMPGRTLKGLLREQAGFIAAAQEVDRLFGTAEREGALRFSNAVMGEEEAEAILAGNLTAHLYRRVSSTAIDNDGIAKDHSLRSIETVVPMTLYAAIEGDKAALETIGQAAGLIRCAGTGRNRGFGACKIEIEERA